MASVEEARMRHAGLYRGLSGSSKVLLKKPICWPFVNSTCVTGCPTVLLNGDDVHEIFSRKRFALHLDTRPFLYAVDFVLYVVIIPCRLFNGAVCTVVNRLSK